MSELKLDAAELQALFRSMNGPMYREINRITTGVWNASRAMGNVPVDKGRLKESMSMEIRSEAAGIVGVVGTNVEYAVFVHNGTKKHKIRAKNARALEFRIGGDLTYRASVNHPGTKKNPWLIRALQMNGLKPRRSKG